MTAGTPSRAPDRPAPVARRAPRAAGEAARDPRAAAGFPSGARTTPVPDVFFSRDLTTIEDPLALRVLLWVIWHVHRRPAGAPPAVRIGDLAADVGLRRTAGGASWSGTSGSESGTSGGGPSGSGEAATEALSRACGALVRQGLLLECGGWLLVNDRAGRLALDEAAADPARWPDLADGAGNASTGLPAAEGDPSARPTIFALYEQAIGLLTPILAEELAEAAAAHPAAWIERAFRLAAANGVRKWSYVRAILARWARDGYDGDDDEIAGRRPEAARRPDSEGPYAAWIKH